MRRFLLVTSDLPPRRGGVARYHAAVVRTLGAAADVYRVDDHRHWARLILALPQALRRTRTNTVLVGEVLPVGTVAWILRRMGGISYAVMCHGLDLRNALRVLRKRWMARRILRGATQIIVNSRFTAALAEQLGADIARVHIVPPPLGITPALTRSAHSPDVRASKDLQHVRIIYSVGRMVPRKGFDTLIRAVAALRHTFPQVVLAIAGDGPDRGRLETLARSERIAVRFLGNLEDEQCAAWYAACDIFALLPRELQDGDVEGFGIVYLEAGSFGKPVLGTRSGGVPEAVIDQHTGLLVPADDPNAAAGALASLLRDPNLRRRLGTEGERRANEEYSIEQFAARLRAALV